MTEKTEVKTKKKPAAKTATKSEPKAVKKQEAPKKKPAESKTVKNDQKGRLNFQETLNIKTPDAKNVYRNQTQRMRTVLFELDDAKRKNQMVAKEIGQAKAQFLRDIKDALMGFVSSTADAVMEAGHGEKKLRFPQAQTFGYTVYHPNLGHTKPIVDLVDNIFCNLELLLLTGCIEDEEYNELKSEVKKVIPTKIDAVRSQVNRLLNDLKESKLESESHVEEQKAS